MRYLLVTILALSASAFAQTDEQRAAIADRIKSFSNVCVAGQDCGGASVADAAVASLPGEAKYAGCAACHGPNGGGGIGPALVGREADYIDWTADGLPCKRDGWRSECAHVGTGRCAE